MAISGPGFEQVLVKLVVLPAVAGRGIGIERISKMFLVANEEDFVPR